jgi:hypothetical protein
MGRLLLFLFLVAAASFVLFASIGIALLWRLRRRNRLHPSWPTSAPVLWLVHPGRPARLHRRLRAAVATAGYRAPGRGRHKVPHSSVDELVTALVHEAVALDEQLVIAGRAPAVVRRRLVATTAPQVAKLESVAGRLAVLVSASARPGGVPAAEALQALEDRLDAIEVSRQEIADLEAALFVDLTADDTRSEI